VKWQDLSEEELDWFLAEACLDGYDSGEGKLHYNELLSAVGRENPRIKLKVSWRVMDVWNKCRPATQAAAAPAELLIGIQIVALAFGPEALGVLLMCCFCGLLRVSETLRLHGKDVIFAAGEVVLCLGETKRGAEQKVVLRHPVAVAWLLEYWREKKPGSHDCVFAVSYNSIRRWLTRIAYILGADLLALTTHSFRRSGATELIRCGVPLPTVMEIGRWTAPTSARLYIRQGEVAMLRASAALPADCLPLCQLLTRLSATIWQIRRRLHSHTRNLKPSQLSREMVNRLAKG